MVDPLDGVLAFLRPAAGPVTVGTRMPASAASGRYVMVRRSGGPWDRSTMRDRPRVDVMAWADDERAAFALAYQLREALLLTLPAVASGVALGRATEFAGPAAYPDPAGSDRPFVMFTVELSARAA